MTAAEALALECAQLEREIAALEKEAKSHGALVAGKDIEIQDRDKRIRELEAMQAEQLTIIADGAAETIRLAGRVEDLQAERDEYRERMNEYLDQVNDLRDQLADARERAEGSAA